MTSDRDFEWRLTVKFDSEARAHGLLGVLKTHVSATLVADRLKQGVVVQHDGTWVRIYGDSYEALRRGQAIVASVIEDKGVRAEEQAERRVGVEAGWESVEIPPPPERDASVVSEHHGPGPWGSETEPDRVQVHFELDSRRTAQRFAKELATDGYDVHQAGSFVFIFADDAASARKLGNALKERAPANAQLFFEGEGRAILF
jgi:hypothetical protein